jgi:apolipoprotein D and lipocalin family protein
MRNSIARLLGACFCFGLPALAAANAPEPRRPIDLDRFMGRWYEILRTPNDAQKNCFGAFQVWSQVSPGRFNIAQTCHRDSPEGPERHVQTGARVLDPPADTKFEASFFAGLIRRDYWVLDHAEDYGWMIASTSNGKYISLLARKPGMAKRQIEALTARIAAMGLAIDRLVAVGAPAD